ncbi:MAG: flagellar biosynthesis protein FlhF [Firmicutes bacterium]|nr:flagellar biosynthesis protein FlhF [Bacillota bacterium]
MRIKRYESSDLQSAIQKVKAELGENAIILNTRRRKKGGLWGWFGKEIIEITAAVADTPKIRPRPLPPPTAPLAVPPQPQMLSLLQNELNEIKTMVSDLTKEPRGTLGGSQMDGGPLASNQHLMAFNNLLISNDVTGDNATALIEKVVATLPREKLEDYEQAKAALLRALAIDLKITNPTAFESGQQIVALVGPTGVGKTTTIAKLAARSALLENRGVSLITADTYRIAAVEQLRRYAEIIGVPLEVVLGAEDLQKALEQHKDKNLILIDTAGRSQRNIVQLSELRNILSLTTQVKTLLVLSLTTKYRDLLDITTKYQRVEYDALLFTKLDETTSYGSIYNIAKATGKPLTYITTGQNVPDDIEAAEPMKIAKMILRET